MKYKNVPYFFCAFIILSSSLAFSAEIILPQKISRETAIQMVLAPNRWADPDNLYNASMDIGVYSSCRGVSDAIIRKAMKGIEFGVSLGTTEFDVENRIGYRNDRLFYKLMQVSDRGFKNGLREGRLMRGQRGWRDLCNFIEETWIDGDLKDLPTELVVQ